MGHGFGLKFLKAKTCRNSIRQRTKKVNLPRVIGLQNFFGKAPLPFTPLKFYQNFRKDALAKGPSGTHLQCKVIKDKIKLHVNWKIVTVLA